MLCKMRSYSFEQGPFPPICPPIAVIYDINLTKPPPFVIAYCKQSKTGWWKGLGMGLLPLANIVTDPCEVVYDYLSLCIFKREEKEALFLVLSFILPLRLWV